MTDSMAYCDVILPACSHFEHEEIFAAYGQNWLQRSAPAIPPVGEALPNTEIFRRLAARFGFDGGEFTASDEQLIDDAYDAEKLGRRASQLPTGEAVAMKAADGATPQMCVNVKPATPSGRIELYSDDLAERFDCGLPQYRPLTVDRDFTLVTPSSFDRTNATFGSHPAGDGPEPVEIHPKDAAARGIADGDLLRVHNDRGEVQLRARLSDKMRRGVVYSPKGAWRRSSATGQTTNALITADLKADIAGGAIYNETYVDIDKT